MKTRFLDIVGNPDLRIGKSSQLGYGLGIGRTHIGCRKDAELSSMAGEFLEIGADHNIP